MEISAAFRRTDRRTGDHRALCREADYTALPRTGVAGVSVPGASICCSGWSTTGCRRSGSGIAQPVRDVKRLTRLLCDKIEKVDPGFGIEITLAQPGLRLGPTGKSRRRTGAVAPMPFLAAEHAAQRARGSARPSPFSAHAPLRRRARSHAGGGGGEIVGDLVEGAEPHAGVLGNASTAVRASAAPAAGPETSGWMVIGEHRVVISRGRPSRTGRATSPRCRAG